MKNTKISVERIKQLEKQKKRCWLSGAIFGVCFIVIKHILDCWDSENSGFDFGQFFTNFSYKDLLSIAIASVVYAIILRFSAANELNKIQKGFKSETKRK